MRRLRPDPVPEDLVLKVLTAAGAAPSPGNTQGWDFVVVREPGRRAQLASILAAAVAPLLPSPEPEPEPRDIERRDPSAAPGELAARARRRLLESARHLVAHAGEVPVWILVCGRAVYPPAAPSADWIGAAVYPAAQNLLLAARALGLGATFTTWHRPCEERVRSLLGIPEDVHIAVTIPLGWPDAPFGPVRRKPLEDIVHMDGWRQRS
jgi:nitroreductase